MLLRRRLMYLKSKTYPAQDYDVLDVGISLVGIQLSDDLDKDIDSLGLNVGITLEAV